MANVSRLQHGRRGVLDAATCGDPARVAAHLYVGSTVISRDVNLLRAIGITHVLNTGGTSNWAGSRLGLSLMQRDIADEHGWPLAPHLDETFEFIDSARTSGGACFVCSDRGVSRCAAIAAYYLMRSERLAFSDALHEVIEVRSCCCPNASFVTELDALSSQFEKKALGAAQPGQSVRSRASTQLPLLHDAARRARELARMPESNTRWRVGVDAKQGHVVHVGIGRQGFTEAVGARTGSLTPRAGMFATQQMSGRAKREELEAQRARKAARDMERHLTSRWEQEQREQQEAEAKRRAASPRAPLPPGVRSKPTTVLGGMYASQSSRSGMAQQSSSPRGLVAAGCAIGSCRGCLCQICFLNDTPARARSARIKKEIDIHPDIKFSTFAG